MGLFGIKSKPKKVEIDYNKLADAIVKAHNHIKEQEQIEQCNEQKQLEVKWNEALNYKEYPETRNIFLKGIRGIRNAFFVLVSVIFFKKENVKEGIVTFGLMRMAMSLIFGTIKWVLYAVAVTALFVSFYLFSKDECIIPIICILFSIVIIVFAQLFRIAAYEVDNIHDRQNLIGLFSAISAFLALIVAIISLVVAVMK